MQVASTVKVPTKRDTGRSSARAPHGSSSKNLVLKAVAEADRSIASRQEEDRRRSDELEAIHAKRRKLSEAMKQGNLDERKIQEINRGLERKEEEEREREDRRRIKRDKAVSRKGRGGREEEVKTKRAKRTSSSTYESPSKKKTSEMEEKEATKPSPSRAEKKKAGPAAPMESLDLGDLRHRLGARRRDRELLLARPGKEAGGGGGRPLLVEQRPKFSNLTVQISNTPSFRLRRQKEEGGDEEEKEEEARRKEMEAEAEVQRKARQGYEERRQQVDKERNAAAKDLRRYVSEVMISKRNTC